MAKVVIFGVKDFAELAHFYLEHDSPHEVAAFSVNRDYLPEGGMFRGLPVVPFEEVEKAFPPRGHMFFAPMAPKNMNRDREQVYNAIKAKGYGCISYVSSKATLFGNEIGDNCFILEDNTIQPFTKIGNNVVLWSGNHIGHHGVIHDHVMFTSHVVMSGHCEIGAYSFFGVNSTLRDGLKIAEGTFVAMAAAVMHDTEAWGAYKGNPAEKLAMPSTKIRM
ncbi:acyl-[acyl-carrier-protein]--UDP-N-acetylglucosamine O-acyltransferase [mine drainage metagenome]|uniref:Acyl-[acyl-carrier-protein]--UDP-N-acetylglucosamine O-acyltransferase n=1 Tax=mine drainage metagenome TaxID=410659 RepID=A0A1J5SSI8_9ZZZZ